MSPPAVPPISLTQVVIHADSGGTRLGSLAIDRWFRSRAHGGLRIEPLVREDILCALAHTMTLKYGYLRLPFGGAKGAVAGDPDAERSTRQGLLDRYAQAIGPLLRSRAFVPAADMGTDEDLIRGAMRASGSPLSPRQLKVARSGDHTAWTVFHTLRAAAAYLGLSVRGKTAALEGFGKVGLPLARLLAEAGVRVVAISTARGALYDPDGLDIPRLAACADRIGSRVVEDSALGRRQPPDTLAAMPVDILLPCAGVHSLHAGNAALVHARLICPGANNPATPDAEALLTDQGKLVVPDFLANYGGVLGSVLEFARLPQHRIRRLMKEHVEAHLPRLLALAKDRREPLRAVGESLAMARYQTMVEEWACQRRGPRLVDLGVWMYHRGLVPAALFSRLAAPSLERRLAWEA